MQNTQASLLKRKWRSWSAELTIVLMAIVFMSPWVVKGHIFLATDFLNLSLPWSASSQHYQRPYNSLISDPVVQGFPIHYHDQIRRSRLEHWNPLILGGLPSINSLFTGYARFYFPNMIAHRFLELQAAYMMMLLLHLIGSGLFMNRFLTLIGCSSLASWFGAVIWMFNGCAMVWFEFFTTFVPFTYCPLLLIFFEKIPTRRGLFYAAVGGLVMGTYLLAMHIQYVLYFLILSVFYVLFLGYRLLRLKEWETSLGHLLARLATMGCIAGCVGAIELFPMYDLVQDSFRSERHLGFIEHFNVLGRVYFRHLITLIFPEYFGSPVVGANFIPARPEHEYMNFNELCFYVGIPSVLGCLAAVFSKQKNAHSSLWLLLSVLFLSMMMGAYTYYPFFRLVPGLGKLNPIRITFLFVFSMAVVAAWGLDALRTMDGKHLTAFLGTLTGFCLLCLFFYGFSNSDWMIRFMNEELGRHLGDGAVMNMIRSLRSPDHPVMYEQTLLVAVSAASFLLSLFSRSKAMRQTALALIVVVTCVDLMRFGRHYNTVMPTESIYPKTPGIHFLSQQQGVFRVVLDCARGFTNNVLGPFGIEELGGYANVYSMRTSRLLSFIESQDPTGQWRYDRWVMFRNHRDLKSYKMMNVKYLISAPGVATNHPELKKVYDDEISIFEIQNYLQRGYLVHKAITRPDIDATLQRMIEREFDPAAEVILEGSSDTNVTEVSAADPTDVLRMISYESDRIEWVVKTNSPGWLVVSNTFHPSWKAYIDNDPVEIQRANVNLMAVAVPPGSHSVRLEFKPVLLEWAKALTLFGYGFGIFACMAFTRHNIWPRVTKQD